MNDYLKVKTLYGDDFNPEQIKKWYQEEEDAFFDLWVEGKEFAYEYSALDSLVGFPFLTGELENVLGIGSGFGVEFLPIIDKIKNLTIIENSDKYNVNPYIKKSINYCKAAIVGSIPAADNTFDLVVCFSTWHHIPNVSFMISEFTRVLKNGGILFIREPIVSTGDWTSVRKHGLSKNERGIPLSILRDIIWKNGLSICRETLWNFRSFCQLMQLFSKKSIYQNHFYSRIDLLLSSFFKWNMNYHPSNMCSKLRPIAILMY